MHNIKFIRANPDDFDKSLALRGLAPLSAQLLALDEKRRALIHEAESLKAEQNEISKSVGAAKAAGDEAEFQRLRQLVSDNKARVQGLEIEAKEADEALTVELMGVPNIPFPDVPLGRDESDNVEIRKWGTPKIISHAKEHFEIEAVKSYFDFERAGRISGARFMILRSHLARLHRAIGQFMIDVHVNEHGLEEVITPVLVRDNALYGTGNLPKFAEDLYKTTENHWLIPTAEVPLANLVAGEQTAIQALPMRFTAQTQCFRSEAGSAGRDTSGILRQHQFEKIEMVTICHPDESENELERMTKCAETILEKLNIPYRTVMLCTGDMGFSSRRTYDIEAWIPGQNKYREISSCSNCGEFQARRMNARFRDQEGNLDFLHTLNGSGLAVGRTLIAVLENGQNEDGSVSLPEALAHYLGGKTQISTSGELI